jgi:NADPH-dependent curcumin reductase
MQNQRVVLASRPQGAVVPSNFRLESAETPALNDGDILVRNHYLSLDPYMRGRMEDAKSYAAPQAIGDPMIGGTVGEVLESRAEGFAAGDLVVGGGGWQTHSVSPALAWMKLKPGLPLSIFLGAAGMPGITGWYGVNHICKPQPGETLVVNSATGAVGSVVGQLAKLAGARVVGVAGGATKCAIVKDEFGFDECVDYKDPDFKAKFKAAVPKGIDCVFENVGGVLFDESLKRMNAGGRIAVCGLISGYNGENIAIEQVRSILVNKLLVQGFIVSDHMKLWPQAIKELAGLVATGKIKYRETVAEGIAAAPEAFIGLLKGANVGKQLVKLI